MRNPRVYVSMKNSLVANILEFSHRALKMLSVGNFRLYITSGNEENVCTPVSNYNLISNKTYWEVKCLG